MRSTKAKKPLVQNKTVEKIGSWFTGKRMRPIVTDTRLQI